VIFRKPLANASAPIRLLHNGEPVLSAVLGSRPQVRIERATYGVPGSLDRTRDVRQKVQQKVDAGEHSFQVSSLAEGDDPAPNVVKTLEVEYTFNGKRTSAHGTDPERSSLGPPGAEGELVAELHATSTHKLALQAFKPGKYETGVPRWNAPAIQRRRNPRRSKSLALGRCDSRPVGARRRRPRSRTSSPGDAILTQG